MEKRGSYLPTLIIREKVFSIEGLHGQKARIIRCAAYIAKGAFGKESKVCFVRLLCDFTS